MNVKSGEQIRDDFALSILLIFQHFFVDSGQINVIKVELIKMGYF